MGNLGPACCELLVPATGCGPCMALGTSRCIWGSAQSHFAAHWPQGCVALRTGGPAGVGMLVPGHDTFPGSSTGVPAPRGLPVLSCPGLCDLPRSQTTSCVLCVSWAGLCPPNSCAKALSPTVQGPNMGSVPMWSVRTRPPWHSTRCPQWRGHVAGDSTGGGGRPGPAPQLLEDRIPGPRTQTPVLQSRRPQMSPYQARPVTLGPGSPGKPTHCAVARTLGLGSSDQGGGAEQDFRITLCLLHCSHSTDGETEA